MSDVIFGKELFDSYKVLDKDILFKLYLKSAIVDGSKRPSLRKLAKWLYMEGVRSPMTGLGYTHEGLRQVLLQNPDYIAYRDGVYTNKKGSRSKFLQMAEKQGLV